MLFIETLQQGSASAAVVVFKKEDKESKKLNARLEERKEDFRAGKLDMDVSGLSMAPKPFTWAGLNYTVPIKGGQKQLLNDIWGYVKPGSLTALMGASGESTVIAPLHRRRAPLTQKRGRKNNTSRCSCWSENDWSCHWGHPYGR